MVKCEFFYKCINNRIVKLLIVVKIGKVLDEVFERVLN